MAEFQIRVFLCTDHPSNTRPSLSMTLTLVFLAQSVGVVVEAMPSGERTRISASRPEKTH